MVYHLQLNAALGPETELPGRRPRTPRASTAGSARLRHAHRAGPVRGDAPPLRAPVGRDPGISSRKRMKRRESTVSAAPGRQLGAEGPAQELRQDRDHPRRQPGGAAGRAHRRDRPQRRGQVHAVQPDQRPLRAHQRRGAAQWPAHRRQEAVRDQPAGPVAQLPDHQHLPQAQRVREPALRRAVEPGLQVHLPEVPGRPGRRQRARRAAAGDDQAAPASATCWRST